MAFRSRLPPGSGSWSMALPRGGARPPAAHLGGLCPPAFGGHRDQGGGGPLARSADPGREGPCLRAGTRDPLLSLTVMVAAAYLIAALLLSQVAALLHQAFGGPSDLLDFLLSLMGLVLAGAVSLCLIGPSPRWYWSGLSPVTAIPAQLGADQRQCRACPGDPGGPGTHRQDRTGQPDSADLLAGRRLQPRLFLAGLAASSARF